MSRIIEYCRGVHNTALEFSLIPYLVVVPPINPPVSVDPIIPPLDPIINPPVSADPIIPPLDPIINPPVSVSPITPPFDPIIPPFDPIIPPLDPNPPIGVDLILPPLVDIVGNTSTITNLDLGSSISSTIDTANDTDWIRAEIKANHRYTINLEDSSTNQGTLSDTYIKGIYNSNGDLISGTSNDDGGVGYNSQIDFTATETGVYYISAGAYGSNIGSYTLSIDNGTETTLDAITNNVNTTGMLSLNDVVTNIIDTAYDQDWFRIALDANTEYQINLEGSSTNQGTLSDTYIRGIYNSNGNLISGTTNDDDGVGYNSKIDFTTTETGVYYVSAGAYGSNTGSYSLNIDEASII